MAPEKGGLAPVVLRWPDTGLGSMPPPRLARAFRDALASEDLAPSSRRAYVDDVGRFLGWLERERLEIATVTSGNIAAYRQDLAAKRRLPETVRRALYSLRRFFRWVRDEGIRHDSPMERVRIPPRACRLSPRALGREEVAALISAATTTGLKRDRARNQMLVTVLVNTGLRIGELLRLRWADVDLREPAWIVVRSGKWGRHRSIPLNTSARRALALWQDALRARHETLPSLVVASADGMPFGRGGAHRMLVKLSARSGLKGRATPHVLRHSFAREYLSAHPGDLANLARLMGHASIATTAIYVQPRPSELEQRIEVLFPILHAPYRHPAS